MRFWLFFLFIAGWFQFRWILVLHLFFFFFYQQIYANPQHHQSFYSTVYSRLMLFCFDVICFFFCCWMFVYFFVVIFYFFCYFQTRISFIIFKRINGILLPCYFFVKREKCAFYVFTLVCVLRWEDSVKYIFVIFCLWAFPFFSMIFYVILHTHMYTYVILYPS